MQHFRKLLAAVLSLGMACAAAEAKAELITFNFIGRITSVSDSAIFDLWVGDTFTGSYTFESTTPYAVPRDPTLARYLFSGAPNQATFDIGSGYTLDIEEINVSDDWGGYVDQLLVVDRAGDDWFELELLLADFSADPNPTAFSSTELPLVLPDLSVFTHARGSFSTVVSVNYRGHINFDIISMSRQRSPVEIAEPAAITLLSFGLAGVVWLCATRLRSKAA